MWNFNTTLTKSIPSQSLVKEEWNAIQCNQMQMHVAIKEANYSAPPPPPPPALYLNTQPMEVVQSYKYVGVVVSSDLSWSSYIQLVCMKAKKILGLIYRNFAKYTSDSTVILKMYKALVRPHLEYAAQVWSPYMVKDIELLEKVQRFALRICSRNYNLSYEELLDLYKTPSLQDRRSFLSLCTFFYYYSWLCF